VGIGVFVAVAVGTTISSAYTGRKTAIFKVSEPEKNPPRGSLGCY